MPTQQATIGVGVEIIDGNIDAELRQVLQRIQQAFAAVKFNLDIRGMNNVEAVVAGFKDALDTLRDIKNELRNGIKVRVELDDDFAISIAKQLEGAFKESLSKAHPLAKSLGDDISKEVKRGVEEGLRASKRSAKSGGGRKKSEDESKLDLFGGFVADVKPGTKLNQREIASIRQSAANIVSEKLGDLTKSIPRFSSGLATLGQVVKSRLQEINTSAKGGVTALDGTFTTLSKALAKASAKDIAPLKDEIVEFLTLIGQIDSKLKSSTGGELNIFSVLDTETGNLVVGVENYLKELQIVEKVADKTASVTIRRLRDTAETYDFLNRSVVETQKIVSKGLGNNSAAAAALSGLNTEYRSLGQKLSRELISTQENIQLFGQLVDLGKVQISDLQKKLALSKDVTEQAQIEADIRSAQGKVQNYESAIDVLKQELGIIENQRTQVEAQTKANRTNIRIIEEETRLREGAIRQSIQLARASRANVRDLDISLRKFSAGKKRGDGLALTPEEADQAKQAVKKLDDQIAAHRRTIRQLGEDYQNRITELKQIRATGANGYDALTKNEAEDRLNRELQLEKDFNKQRIDNAVESLKKLQKKREEITASGIEGGILDTERTVQAREEAEKLAERFAILKQRMEGLKGAKTSDELLDLSVQMKSLRAEEDALIRDSDKLLGKFRQLKSETNVTEKEFYDVASAVREMNSEIKTIGTSGSFRKLKQEVQSAGVAKFLRDDLDGATEAVARLQSEFARNSALIGQSPQATIRAAAGFARLRSEASTLEGTLLKMISDYNTAVAAGRGLEVGTKAQAREMERLANEILNLNNVMERQQPIVADHAKRARRAGLGFQLYNQELANSIVNNLKFINSMTIVTSAIFLVRRALYDMIEESKAFSRTMTVMQSETLSLTEVFAKFKTEARDTAVEFGVAISEVSEVVKQFGSAGLTAEESLGALRDTMRVIISTSADAEHVTRTVAGIYNVFGDDMKVAGDEFAAFGRIADTLTSIYRNHQAELDEVVQGLRFSSAAGRAAGFSFEEVSAYLSVLNDNLIKSGAAGRGLQVVFAQLANKSDQIAKAFNIQLDPDLSLNEQFLGFLETLNARLSTGALTVSELEKQFSIFGLRGARSAITLVKNVDDVKDAILEMENSQGTAAELAKIVQDELANSFERAKQALLELLRDTATPLKQFFIFFSDVILQIRDGIQSLNSFGINLGPILLVVGTLVAGLQSFLAIVRVIIVTIQGARDAFGALTLELINNTRAIEANNVAKGRSAAATLAMGSSQSKVTGRFAAFTGGVGRLTTALSVVLTILPFLVGIYQSFQTTVAEAAQAVADLDSEFGKLARTRTNLAQFEKEFAKIGAVVEDASYSVESRAKALREVVSQYGKEFIDVNELTSNSSEQLINSYDKIEASIKRQIELEKQLTKTRQETLQGSLRDAKDQQFRSIFVDQTGDGSIDLREIYQRRVALEDFTGSLDELDETAKRIQKGALLNRATDGLTGIIGGLSSFLLPEQARLLVQSVGDLNETVLADVNRFLNNDKVEEAWNRLFSALGRDLTNQIGAASAKLRETIGDLPREIQQQRVLNILFDKDLLIKDAKEWQLLAVDEVLDAVFAVDKAARTAFTPDFVSSPLETVLDTYRSIFTRLEAGVDSNIFNRWSEQIQSATRNSVQFEKELRAVANFVSDPSPRRYVAGVQASIGLPAESFRKEVIIKQLKDLGPEAAAAIFSDLTPELEKQFAELPDKIKRDIESKELELSASLSEPDKKKIAEERYRSEVDAVSRGVVDGLRAAGPAIKNANGEILFDTQKIVDYLIDVNTQLGVTGQTISNVIDKLIAIRGINLFETTADSIARLSLETLFNEAENRKIENPYTKQVSELIAAEQKLNALQETGEKGVTRLQQLTEDLPNIYVQEAQEWLRLNGVASETAEDVLEAGDERTEQLVKHLSQSKNIQEAEQKISDILGQQVDIERRRNALARETESRLGTARLLRREADSSSLQLKNDLAVEIDREKTIRVQLGNLRKQKEVAQELKGDTIAVLAAENELKAVRKQLLESQRRIRELLYEESIQRDNNLARSQRLLDRENKLAGVNFEISSIRKQIRVVDTDLLRIQGNFEKKKISELQLQGEIRTQFEKLLDIMEQANAVQDKLKETALDINNVLSLRADILRSIFEVYNSENAKIESDLGTALQNAFDADPLVVAANAAAALGIQFSVARDNFGDLKDDLIEGIRSGTISAEAFGTQVSAIAGQFTNVQTEANGVADRLRAIEEAQIARFTEQFRTAFDKKNIQEASTALSSLKGVLSSRFANDPRELVGRLEDVEEMAQRLQGLAETIDDQFKIKIQFLLDLSPFDELRQKIRELGEEIDNVGLLSDVDASVLKDGKLIGVLSKMLYLMQDQNSKLQRFKTGGPVPGGYGGGDIVPAMLEPGEFVIPKEAVKRMGPGFFEQFRGYQDGGSVEGFEFDYEDIYGTTRPLLAVKPLLDRVAGNSPTFTDLIYQHMSPSDFYDTNLDSTLGYTLGEAAAAYNPAKRSIIVSTDMMAAVRDNKFNNGQVDDLVHELYHLVSFKKRKSEQIMADIADQISYGRVPSANGDLVNRTLVADVYSRSGDSLDKFTDDYIQEEKEAFEIAKRTLEESKIKKLTGKVDSFDIAKVAKEAKEGVEKFFDPAAPDIKNGFNAYQYYLQKGSDLYSAVKDVYGNPYEFATGGFVPGSGSGDIIPAMLEPGEFVIPKKTVQALGQGYFEQYRGYQTGGLVSNPAVIPGSTATQARGFSLFNSTNSKEELKKLAEFFSKDLEKRFGEKDLVANLVDNILSGFKGAFDALTSFFSVDFLFEGANALAAAFSTFDEAVQAANVSFEETITGLERGIATNQSDYFSYIDAVQQAELDRFKARTEAEKALREEIIKTRELYIGAFRDQATGAVESLKKALDSLTPSFADIGGSVSQLSATIKPLNLTRGNALEASIRAASGQSALDASNRARPNEPTQPASPLDMAEFRAASERFAKWSVENDKLLEDQKKLEADRAAALSSQYKAEKANQQAIVNLVGNGLLSILGTGLSVVFSGLQKVLSFFGNPAALRDAIDGLKSFVTDFTQNAGRYVTEILEGVDELATVLVESLPEVLNTVIQELPRLLEGLISTLAQALPEVLKILAAELPSLIRALVPLLGDLVVVILDNIPYIVQAMVGAIPTLIFEIIKQMPKILLGLVKAQIGVIIAYITGIIGGIIEIFVPGFMKKITEAFGRIMDGISKAFDLIASLFRKLTEDEKQAKADAKANTTYLERRSLDVRALFQRFGVRTLSESEIETYNDLRPRQQLASGGRIPGYGGGDIVPAMLEPGEFVIPKEVVRSLGPDFFERMRNNELQRFAAGGLVGGTGGVTRGSFGGTTNMISQVNNIGVTIDGNATESDKRKAANDLVDFIDEALERKRKNRNLKFGR